MIIRLILSHEGLTSSHFQLVCTRWVERLGWLADWLVLLRPDVNIYSEPRKHRLSVRLRCVWGARLINRAETNCRIPNMGMRRRV